jgi:hypothetical protein
MSKKESHEASYLATETIIEGLVSLDAHQVRARYPRNNQYEAIDEMGNKITYVYKPDGNLFRPIEIQDADGHLLAKSTDGINWQTSHFDTPNVDFTLEGSDEEVGPVRVRKVNRTRGGIQGLMNR